MAKKELNVFNVSFLDLLSGALGAVLILFVIVPKLTSDITKQLEELEQIKELKVDVTKIENMMSKLKQSVPDAVFKELEERMNKLKTTVEDLALEVKSLQNKLAECDAKREKLREKVKQKEQRIKELEEQLKNNGTLVEQLKEEIETQKTQFTKEITELNGKITECDKEKAGLQQEIEETEKQVTTLEVKKSDLETEVEKLQKELAKAKEKIKNQTKEITGYKERLGFEFADKNVVFVVDISGSMDDDPEPQKLNEVQAGIKMMIATMSNDYKVDIVVYPKSADDRYGYKYGKLTKVTEDAKYDMYKYLTSLKAAGCTPTKEVMEYVLNSPSYADAGTIILLSDGLPTDRVSYTECEEYSDTSPIESFIKQTNGGKRVINCIGVGRDFRNRSTSDPKVRFMQNVAKQNGGFYIGF